MSTASFSFQGKVAIVTGSRRGIGRAIALAFAEAGADVAVCDLVIEDGELQAVADEIKKLGRRSLAVQTDVTQKAQVDDLVKRVVDEFGTIDIMVNCVGVPDPGAHTLIDIPEDTWNKMIAINLNSVLFCSQAAGKVMVEQNNRGNIISLASQAAFKSYPRGGVYSVSKAGVAMFTRVLARELAPYNIRVNAIAPSVVKTEFMSPFIPVIDWSNPEFEKALSVEVPIGRVAEPSEIASAVLFLASDAASYITGATMLVDGGASA
jgi:NAD(P)-dependent dehydrogenase (short-subunit alcohol dehydrogenase family)